MAGSTAQVRPAVAPADIEWVLEQVRELHHENRYTDTHSAGAFESRRQLLEELEEYLKRRSNGR